MTKRPTPRGRPRKHGEIMLPRMVRFPGPMIDEIEAIAAARIDGADISSVIRELIAEALSARRKGR
ncbi:MAG: hypothetical protein ACOYLQ_09555 [Hyphomicrobiaceae bacterium]